MFKSIDNGVIARAFMHSKERYFPAPFGELEAALLVACYRNDLEEVRRLLDAGANVNTYCPPCREWPEGCVVEGLRVNWESRFVAFEPYSPTGAGSHEMADGPRMAHIAEYVCPIDLAIWRGNVELLLLLMDCAEQDPIVWAFMVNDVHRSCFQYKLLLIPAGRSQVEYRYLECSVHHVFEKCIVGEEALRRFFDCLESNEYYSSAFLLACITGTTKDLERLYMRHTAARARQEARELERTFGYFYRYFQQNVHLSITCDEQLPYQSALRLAWEWCRPDLICWLRKHESGGSSSIGDSVSGDRYLNETFAAAAASKNFNMMKALSKEKFTVWEVSWSFLVTCMVSWLQSRSLDESQFDGIISAWPGLYTRLVVSEDFTPELLPSKPAILPCACAQKAPEAVDWLRMTEPASSTTLSALFSMMERRRSPALNSGDDPAVGLI